MNLPYTMPEYYQDSLYYYAIDEQGRMYQVAKDGKYYWEVPTGCDFFYLFKQYKRKTCQSAPASVVENLLQPFKNNLQ
jgi:hypothetical protein